MLYLVSFWDINKWNQLFRSSIRRVVIRDRMNKILNEGAGVYIDKASGKECLTILRI